MRAISQLDAVPPLAVSGKLPSSTSVGLSTVILYLSPEVKKKLLFQLLIRKVVLFETASRGLACVFAGQRRALLYDLEEDEEGQDDEME